MSSVCAAMEEASVIKKKKRNLPGTPDPEAEVIALSPRTLMATNRFSCDVCGKGFQRDQNLQLHRRGHNLPWKLKQREGQDIRKKVYVCPEILCIHHDPSRALGDLTGIKKHYSRKHGEKKWKCEKCSKRYAVQSDWKAHKKVCGTREYRCDCGTLFSRRDSFITHRAFCGALAEENAKEGTPKKVNSQQSDGGWHENNSPSVRTGELSSPIDAPTTPSQLTCSSPDVDIGEPPIKESFKPPLVKEVFKETSIKENFKQPLIKENFGSGLVKETSKYLPLEEAFEQPKCALEESTISSVSLKMTQDDVGAQAYKPRNFFIKQPNCDMDENGMSLVSSKQIQTGTGAQPDNTNKFGFIQSNCDLEENGISSLSSEWTQDGVGVQSYKPRKIFKPHCASDDSTMPAVSVAPKWMQDGTGEQSYKSSKDFNQPSSALSESGIPSVSPNWIQDGRVQLDKANKGPIPLSLCLGPGPSLGALPEADRAKPFKEMNQITQVTLTENEARNQWPLLSHDSDTLTRMLTSGISNNTEDSDPYHVLNDVRSHTDKVTVETLPYSSTNVSQSYFIGNPSKPSNNHHRYNTANGQMPATSLLQKAAMMGATSSNPYLLRNFGLRGRNALSNMISGGSDQDSWAGPTFSSMWHGGFATTSSTNRVCNLDQFSHESGASAQGSLYDDRKARIQGLPKATSANVSSLLTNPDSSFDDAHGDNRMLLLGVSKVSNNSTILAGCEGLQGTDKHEGDRTTLDLLGVGSLAMCMEEKTISYRRIGGINSLSSI